MTTLGKFISLHPHTEATRSQRRVYPYGSMPFYFHVPPDQYRVSGSANHAEQTIARYGSISQFGGPSLKTVSFESFFLMRDWLILYDRYPGDRITGFPDYVMPPPSGYAFFDATQSIKMLEELRDGDYPVQLRIIDRQIAGHVELTMPVTVREFEWGEHGGEPDARDFSIGFTQYRPVRIRRVPHAGAIPLTSTNRPIGRRCNRYHVSGVSVGIKTIARHCYGRTDRWKWIVAKNGGDEGMRRLVRAGKAEYRPRDYEGPWYFKSGVTLVTPPVPQPTGGADNAS